MESIIKIQKVLQANIFKGQSNFKKSPKARITEQYLETRLEVLEGYWQQFEQNHYKLLSFVDEETMDNEPYFESNTYENVEEKYIDYKSELKMNLTEIAANREPIRNEASTSKQTASLKLPKIILPVFSGKYLEWPTFHDLFNSMIHQSDSLANVQKLHYLKSHLTGEAEQLLRHIPITEANYISCWTLLKKRYNNKRYIANCILTRLVNQKALSTESANGVKLLLDTTTDCLNALSNIGIDVSTWDILIIHLIAQKLDTESRKQWEQKISDVADKLPTLPEFKGFLESRFRALEFIDPKQKKDLQLKSNLENPKINSFKVTTFTCPFCSDDHLLYQCKKFHQEEFKSRHEFVHTNNLCFNCFGANHSVAQCRRNTSCRRCHRRHHSLLHPDGAERAQSPLAIKNEPEGQTQQPEGEEQTNTNNIVTHFAKGSVLSPGHVMLATTLVKIESKQNLTVRALLDQGSQASFITENVVQMLGLRKIPVSGLVSGLGGDQLNMRIKHKVNCKIQSTCTSSSYIIQAYVLNSLSSTLPAHEVQLQDWPELATLRLADPGYGKPQKIDMLLGAEIYGQVLENGIIRNPPGTLTAQNTTLGWILSGRLTQVDADYNHCSHTIINFHIEDHAVNELLRKFWELETDNPREKILSPEDQRCEKIFESTTTRDESGRYVVRLPFKSDKPECQYGNSRSIALRRFELLEKKLNRNPVLKSEYSRAINEYISMQHMEPVPEGDLKSASVYLPHHAVVREDKTTTKVRIVFDASCKGLNGKSLNDDLLIGPRLQPDLRHLLLKWRTHRICFVADVVKMYLQVKVAPDDTDYQRLLWRESPDEDVKDYRLLRVTFGVSSAPYLAVKSLQQTSKDYGREYPLAAKRVLDDFYMDDYMSGCETEKEAIEIYRQTKEILSKGGFELQKWASNSEEVMKEFRNTDVTMREANVQLKSDAIVKILGLSWNIKNDTFEYNVKLPPQKLPVTKRVILSDISRLFDPLGWISPVIIQAKIYMQKLWLEGLQWDDELGDDLLKEWTGFRASLPALNKFEIPRWLEQSKVEKKEVHGFCDASNNAYAAVAYLRVIGEHGEVSVNLIASRTKVAPTSPVSVPRLELLGAQLLANLLKELATVMEIPKSDLHAWTDSTVVLAWLRGHPCRWKTFVANRVTDILSILDNDQWSHVESSQNPADCASRGLCPDEFLEHELWLHGPSWLRQQFYDIPRDLGATTDLESKSIKSHLLVSNTDDHPVWEKYSSLTKLKRVIALCLKFKRLALNKVTDLPSHPTVQDLEQSLVLCLKVCQNAAFSEDLDQLKRTGSVAPKSRLSSLCPFIDSVGIMRVQGRIQQSQEDYDVKHPVILPSDHHISKLIIAEAHENTLHGGPQLTLNYLRSKYWIINAKDVIRNLIRKCVKCIRYGASISHPMMGQLPSSRVTISRPFSRSGVDYAGPINVRMSKGRGCRCYKGYICLFICMVTRAIHLEAVSDLTTEGFLAAFKRFIARRGHCHEIWSDNGTNFVGASKVLQSLFKGDSSIMDTVQGTLSGKGVDWHFIPPHAPNFGGLWEAGVRSTKFHLRRILDGTTLTFEELSTVLTQVEACLNSRPMYRLPSNLEDAAPLTPGHFLVGEPLVTIPDPQPDDQHIGILRRWQLTQRLVQQFWRKWSQEYLTTLNNRYKWTSVKPEPLVGDVVLVREDGLPPCRWMFGLIEAKHPGPDNVTRVVTLKYKNSKIKRPVSKLCILPLAD